ncbi:MAG: DUF4423 domain-containing protein [Polyangiaceae bacterium]|nr:DUF4423 domain-containing protein [Polyangiaceae bacterium]
MNYETLASELIRALRGRRSQVALSRRLHYGCNVVYTWESGRRFPTAAVFFELLERLDVNPTEVVREFVGTLPEALTGKAFSDPMTIALFLKHLQQGRSIVELARGMGRGRVSVGRWILGQAEPRLPDFLRFIDAASLRVLDFLALLVDVKRLPEAERAWSILEAQREVAYGLPWSHAVLRVLELTSYKKLLRHQPSFIAERLGISLSEEERCLRALSASKLIRKKAGLWVALDISTIDTRRDPGAGRQLKAHWASVGNSRLPELESNKHDLFSYNLFTVSEADWERLRELHIAYYHELRRIIEASKPAERVALVNLQLLRLDEPFRRQGPTGSP